MNLQSHEALSGLTHLFQKWELTVQRRKVTAEGWSAAGLDCRIPAPGRELVGVGPAHEALR